MLMANGEEEKIFTFDVSDAALEIAGTASGRAKITWGICTTNEPGCPPSIVSENAANVGRTKIGE